MNRKRTALLLFFTAFIMAAPTFLQASERSNEFSNLGSISGKTPVFESAVWPYKREAIREGLVLLFESWNELTLDIDDELVRHVFYFYKYYSMVDRHGTNRVIRRSGDFFPEIRNVFERHGLPEELAFAIPFVESAFVNKARSDKKAVGMFQFLKGTARAFNLKITDTVDERMDYRKSAMACAGYLSKNRELFDSTVLSVGSFHHGTSGLTRVLRMLPVKADRRDFVSIFNHRRLGKYSKEYIPKCLAAALIFRFLKEMRLDAVPEIEVESRKMPRFAHVKDLKSEYPDLLRLNPDLEKVKTTYLYATTRGYLLIEDLAYAPDEEAAVIVRQSRPDRLTPVQEVARKGAEDTGSKSGPKNASPERSEPVPEVIPEAEVPPERKPTDAVTHVPGLAGKKWDESFHARFENRLIVMNQSYTGVIEELGIIFDQNLKPGDEWPEGEVLILEVGRPPIPEDELTSEEYTRFIQEYMSILRQK